MAVQTNNDAIIHAIDIMVNQRIAGLDYDKTVICKIINDEDSMNGHYVVNDGSISFDAYCEDSSYRKDESVYVTVPKGDFTQKKIIISKYTADNNEEPLAYKSPLANMFIVSNNLAQKQIMYNNSILANGRTVPKPGELLAPGQWRQIWEYDLSTESNASFRNNALFDSLGIRAKFKCALGTTYPMKSGHYGLIIELYSTPNNDSSAKGTQQTRFLFDTSEMFGNPYNFLSYFAQEKVMDISKLGDITKINIYLYQSSDFYYTAESEDGEIIQELVPSTMTYYTDLAGHTIEMELNPNIFVDGLEVYFGMNTSSMEDNTFMIYSASTSGFNMEAAASDSSYNEKSIIPIWFNKDENNNYIGFSDGIYSFYDFKDIDSSEEPVGREYDEREYLKKAEYVNRGAKLKQSDLTDKNIPTVQELLQIYSYGLEIDEYWKNLLIEVNTKMTRSINSLVDDLRSVQKTNQQNETKLLKVSLLGNQDYSNMISELDAFVSNKTWINTLVESLQFFGQWYINGYQPSNIDYFERLYEAYDNFQIKYDDYRSVIEDFLNDIVEYIDIDVKAVYDLWSESINKIFDNCQDYLTKIQNLLDLTHQGELINSTQSQNDEYMDCIAWQYHRAKINFSNRNIEDYDTSRQNFIDSYANRYSIYWYKYEAGYKNENEKFLTQNWRLIEDKINCGLPAQGSYEERDDRNKYWIDKPDDSESMVRINVGDKSLAQEYIRAVLVYNHQTFVSNVLTFTNENPVVDDATIDAVKGLYIATTDEEYYLDQFDEQGHPVQKHEDTYNNKEVYQLYGITGYLVNQAERYKIRKLRARFNGSQKGDDYLSRGCVIYWYIPLNATMIDVKREDLINAGFSYYSPDYVREHDELEADIQSIDVDQILASDQSDATDVDKLLAAIDLYNIEPYKSNAHVYVENTEDPAADQVLVLKDILLNELIAKKRQEFKNGKYGLPPIPYGNNYQEGYIMVWKNITEEEGHVNVESTEFFYQIKDYYIPSFTNNTIKCRVVKDGQYIYEAEQSFTFASFGTNGTDYSLCIVPATNQSTLRDDNGLALKVAVYDVNGDIMEDETNKIVVDWYKHEGGVLVGGQAPDILVTRIGTSRPIGYNILRASVDIEISSYSEAARGTIINGNASNNGTLALENDEDEEEERQSRIVTLTAYYPIAWSSEDLYIEGPTTVVYDSLGTNPSYYNGPYKLFYGITNQASAHQRYIKEGKELIVSTSYYATGANTLVTTLVKESLPKIKTIQTEQPDEDGVYDRFDLSVPSMFLENDFFTTVWFGLKSGNIVNWVYAQPILMIQNRFSSPMLNSWDGELTIDEKNGTILSTMVGAGIKEEDNTFSGVLMGDVATKAEDSSMKPGKQGVYGFNHGEQSFGFMNDGTAFIGKAGRGRIEFNGNSGQIQSSSFATDKIGMRIDLDDGEIDMRGAYIDYEDQSNPWKAASQYSLVNGDSNNRQYYIPNASDLVQGSNETDEVFAARVAQAQEAQKALNNNEVNGYNNTTKYTPTGSRVLISTRTPFFQISSPSVFNSTETNFSNTIEKFWRGKFYSEAATTEAQKKMEIREYLNNVWNLYAPWTSKDNYTEYRALTSPSEVHTGEQYIGAPGGQTRSPEVGQFTYRRVKEDIKYSLVSQYMVNGMINSPYEEDLETDDDPIIFHTNDYIKCTYGMITVTQDGVSQQVNGIKFKEYVPRDQALKERISEFPTIPQFLDGCVVNNQNVYLSSFIDGFSQTISLANVPFETLVNNIYNASTDPADLDTLEKLKANWKFRFLKGSSLEYAAQLYLSAHNEDKNYLRIKESKNLMLVGTDEYYLQTDNYQKGHLTDSPWPYFNGRGVKFDLMNGVLDAYDFGLTAADPSNGSYIKLNSSGNPFLQISYRGPNRNINYINNNVPIDLLKISSTDFILQSQNWYNNGPMIQNSGTKFDLKNGELTSYGFNLVAYDNSTQYQNSYIKISSHGTPFFKVHLEDNAWSQKIKVVKADGTFTMENVNSEGGLVSSDGYKQVSTDLIKITKSEFIIQSANFRKDSSSTAGMGLKIDVNKGNIIGYNTKLQFTGSITNAVNGESDVVAIESKKKGTLTIDSSDPNTPFAVVSGESGSNNHFRVYWDGSISASAGLIGGWRINNTSLWANGTTNNLPNNSSFRLSSVDFGRDIYVYGAQGNGVQPLTDLRIAIGQKFGVTKDGTLYGYGAYLNNISVNNANINYGSMNDVDINSGTIGGWTITSGQLYSGNTYLNSNGTISGAYFSGGHISIGSSFSVDVNGNLTANNANLSNATIAGDVTADSFVWGSTNQTMILSSQTAVSDLTSLSVGGASSRYPAASGIVTGISVSYDSVTVATFDGTNIGTTDIYYVTDVSALKGVSNSTAGYKDLLTKVTVNVRGEKTTFKYVGG